MRIDSNLTTRIRTGIKAGMLGLAMLPVQLPALAKDTAQFSHPAAATSELSNLGIKLTNKVENLMKNITSPFKSENAVLTGETKFKPILIKDVKDPSVGTVLEGKVAYIETVKDVSVYKVVDKKILPKRLQSEKFSNAYISSFKDEKGQTQLRYRLDYPTIEENDEDGLIAKHSTMILYGGDNNIIIEENIVELDFGNLFSRFYRSTNGPSYKVMGGAKNADTNKSAIPSTLSYYILKDGEKDTEITKEKFDEAITSLAQNDNYDTLISDKKLPANNYNISTKYLKTGTSKAQKTIDPKTAAINERNSKIDDLNAQISNVQATIDNKRSAISKIDDNIRIQESNYNISKMSLDNLDTYLNTLRSTSEVFVPTPQGYYDLQNMANNALKEENNLKAQKKAVQDEIAGLQQSIIQLQRQIRDIKVEMASILGRVYN